MIKKMTIENFCSIKEKIVLSFEATSLTDQTSYNNFFNLNNKNILKVSAFYGMNASGKSTIIKAFAAIRELIIPRQLQNGAVILPYTPFSLSKEYKEKPTLLSIEFSLENIFPANEYRYTVSYNGSSIIYEKFEKLTSQKYSLLFYRSTNTSTMTSVVDLGQAISSSALLKALRNSVIHNRTFLSMFWRFKIADFYEAYDFFAHRLINISPEVTRDIDIIPNKATMDDGVKQFLLRLLKAADFNITDIFFGKSKRQILNSLPFFESDTLLIQHSGKDNKVCGPIEFINESLGTKKIMILAERLYSALRKPSVLVVDELESSLHPELTNLIITSFLDETINKFNSQLIFASHETTLLDLNLLRRDQINFVYKDDNTCSTYVRSLKDFHIRKTDSVEKYYLAGRFSTSPNTNTVLLEDNQQCQKNS